MKMALEPPAPAGSARPTAPLPAASVPVLSSSAAPSPAARAPNLFPSGKPHSSQGSPGSRHGVGGVAAGVAALSGGGGGLGSGGVMGVGGLYPAGHWTPGGTADLVVSAVLLVMVCSILFMMAFFWRKYKNLQFPVTSYEYSQLSQCDGDSDLTEVADDLGISLGTSSTDEEELEPATIPVTASYISSPKPLSKPGDLGLGDTGVLANNNNDIVSSPLGLAGDPDAALLPLLVSPPPPQLQPKPLSQLVAQLNAPVPLLPQMPPPLQPQENAPRHSLLSDSDEELLQ